MRAYLVAGAALIGALLLAICLGSVPIAPGAALEIVGRKLIGADTTMFAPIDVTVLWAARVPRAVLGAVVGAGLGVAGCATQALVRNPIAEPYLLGLTYGAAAGAVAVLVTGFAPLGPMTASAAAFAGSMAAFTVVYLFARGEGTLSPLRLVLAGIAVTSGLQGIVIFLVRLADDPSTTASVLFWLFGSLADAKWSQLGLPAIVLAIIVIALVGQGRGLNALMLGDETAAGLGVRPGRLRLTLFLLIALLTGVLVALVGGIGFVGLVVPHAVRLLVGADHRRVLPLAALTGAAFLVLTDLAARTVIAPGELPIGVVTAVLGAPTFLWLVRRRARAEVGS
ncbi:iron ABC transporter permease [Nocardia panacis]|uniref:Iron ABC transporter permease n=1 Tax=Nocardia panacis TaxID=2340916 RepID=A0A3A4K0V9_9NOCA|nr:iron ABC transporter permease [Nocardia panacis]RJO70943.1 iron ABC transporter permease [Nocardia panacis]